MFRSILKVITDVFKGFGDWFYEYAIEGFPGLLSMLIWVVTISASISVGVAIYKFIYARVKK